MTQKITPGTIVEAAIESMAYTGRGVARLDDRVIFVAGGIPGDRVTARVVKKKRRFLEAVVVDIIEPSPDRIQAPCRHFDQCGGCSFQNVPYEKQLEYKQDFVRDALERIGGIDNPPISNIIPCDIQFNYRNKMEFSFLPMDSEPARLGLHVRNRWSEVFNIEECLLQSDISNRIVSKMRELVADLNIPAYHISEHHGFIRFLVIRDNKTTGKILLNIVTNKGDFPDQQRVVESLTSEFPQVVAIYRTINSTPANVASGESEELLWSSEDFFETITGFTFKVTPTTFLQTNSLQTRLLYEHVRKMADFSQDHDVLDLYCGCGTISHFISNDVRSILGVEISEDAVMMANENARVNGIANCTFVASDSARYLTELKRQERSFDRIIVDPPRAGIGNKVVRRLARLDPPIVIYVSCNPSTLARDIDQFVHYGYRLVETVPVDMFPHTYHVESVNRLEKQ